MSLIESWRDSLSMFSPKQFNLLSLITRKCLRNIFLHPSSFLVIVPLSAGVAFNMAYHDNHSIVRMLILVFIQIIIVFLVLMVRASVKRKHCYYFLHYWPHMLYVVVFYMLVSLATFWLPFNVPDVIWFFWAPISTLWLLFFVDQRATFKAFITSLWRAVLMFIYSLPVCLIIAGLWFLVFWSMSTLLAMLISKFANIERSFWAFIFGTLVGIVLSPLWYCLLSNIYIKQLHEHFTRYFTVPSD